MIFFSLTNVLFSPSLMLCLTLFQIAILFKFYFWAPSILTNSENIWHGHSESVKISEDQSKFGWWIGCIIKITHIYKFRQILELPSLHPYYNLKLKIDVTTCMFSYFRVRTLLCNCKKLHLFVCLLIFLVVICVIFLLRSDSDQYSH